MDYIPKIKKQSSCSCYGRRRPNLFVQFHEEYYDNELEVMDYQITTRSNTNGSLRWRDIWKRLVKGKQRIFDSGTTRRIAAYDPFAYAQNFDDGSAWVEPENLSRSFSARFATPMLRRFG